MPTLTDAAIRKAKPRPKPWFLYDTGGLYIEIAVSGSKLWRQKYRLAGKVRRQAQGAYPDVSLVMARERAQRARSLVADGIDPLAHKAAVAAAKAASGHLRGRGVIETAHRALQTISQTFRYGIATGRATTDSSRDLRGALTPVKKKHFPAPLDPKRIGEILLALDGYRGTPVVQAALKLGGLVFVRPGELRRAQWADIDFEARQWAFHVTKTKIDHIVPLSIQALAVLETIRPLTGQASLFSQVKHYIQPGTEKAGQINPAGLRSRPFLLEYPGGE